MDNQIILSQIGTTDLRTWIQESVRLGIQEALLPKENIKSDICDLDEAELITGKPKPAIYKLSMEKNRINDPDPLPCYKYGKFLRFKRSELQDWTNRRLKPREDMSSSKVSIELAKSALRKR